MLRLLLLWCPISSVSEDGRGWKRSDGGCGESPLVLLERGLGLKDWCPCVGGGHSGVGGEGSERSGGGGPTPVPILSPPQCLHPHPVEDGRESGFREGELFPGVFPDEMESDREFDPTEATILVDVRHLQDSVQDLWTETGATEETHGLLPIDPTILIQVHPWEVLEIEILLLLLHPPLCVVQLRGREHVQGRFPLRRKILLFRELWRRGRRSCSCWSAAADRGGRSVPAEPRQTKLSLLTVCLEVLESRRTSALSDSDQEEGCLELREADRTGGRIHAPNHSLPDLGQCRIRKL